LDVVQSSYIKVQVVVSESGLIAVTLRLINRVVKFTLNLLQCNYKVSKNVIDTFCQSV